MTKAWRPIFILCPWASTCPHASSEPGHLVNRALTLSLPHLPSTIRTVLGSENSRGIIATSLPAFQAWNVPPWLWNIILEVNIWWWFFLREGESKQIQVIVSSAYLLLWDRCLGLVFAFFSPVPLQFSLFSLSEGGRVMRNSSKSLQTGKHGFSMPLCNCKQK